MVEIENLSLESGERTILRGINLKIRKGEIYSILGPNGAGKSSLAYILMGCAGYQPNSGKILFDGKEITGLPIWKRAELGITLAWQEPARFEGITVKDYLLLSSKNRDGAGAAGAEEALHKVLLEPGEYLNRKVDKTLSGGERKRIELAAVFIMRPRLAILDEPDSGLDILAMDKIMDFMHDIRDRGATVLLITHQAKVAGIAKRAALIGEGSLVKEGTSQEVVKYFEDRCLVCPKFK